MIRISDFFKKQTKKIIDDNKLFNVLEEVLIKEGVYKKIEKAIETGLEKNNDGVVYYINTTIIQKKMRRYMIKNETFTKSQLYDIFVKWAEKQEETLEGGFYWRFEEDQYGDTYFRIRINLK